MPDEVLGAVRNAAGMVAVLEIPLSTIIIIGAAAVAAVMDPTTLPTQVATFSIALRCAGIPITLAKAQTGLQAMTTANGPQLVNAVCNGAVRRNSLTTRIPITLANAQNRLQAMTTGNGPQSVNALRVSHDAVHTNSLTTRAFLWLVSVKAFIIKWAVWAAPFLAWAVLVIFALYVIIKVGRLVIEGTSWGQSIKSIKKRLRSLFPRRRLKQAQGLPSM
jgi:hypothetical protein